MQPVDFFRSRIDAMINLNDPLAVLATRLPWNQIEVAIAAKFEHQNRVGQVLQCEDMFGTTQTMIGGGRSNAGPRNFSSVNSRALVLECCEFAAIRFSW
jgi:IS5 family transposase